MRVDSSTVVRRRSAVIFTRLDDELLGIDSEAGACLSLNETAAEVWALIESPARIETVCRRMVDTFDVDAAGCLADVLELIDELEAAGLVEYGGELR